MDINSKYAALLGFAESVANSRSGNLHGFHSQIVGEARKLVKACGGRLEKMGRYAEGSATLKPHEKYVGGKWHHPIYDKATDSYSFPTIQEQ